MIAAEPQFWSVTAVQIGVYVALAGLFFSVLSMHRDTNRRTDERHQQNIQEIERAASRMQQIETRLDLIYGWFENNVIGRGEKNRHSGQEGD